MTTWRARAAARGALTLALLLAVSACGPSSPEPRRLTEPPNIIIVLVDTLRADHLSGDGYQRATSPNLDAFAASSLRFPQARSQASCTFPSVNSLLTGRYPIHFLGQPDTRMGIPPEIPTLAELLGDSGYATAAVSASPIVRVNPSRFNPTGGFGAGFERFEERCVWRTARCVNQRAAELIAELPQPFFLYLHYMEPHGPYRPPEDHRFRFRGDYSGPYDFIRQGDPNPIATMVYKNGPEIDLSNGELEHLVELYDEEIAHFDDRWPDLLAALDAAGALEDSFVALVGDHGEEFLEHGHMKHCRAPYDTLVRTPFLLHLPAELRRPEDAGRAIDAAVGNIDLLPTLLDYLEIEAPAAVEGASLRSLIDGTAGGADGAATGTRYAFSSQAAWRAVTDGRHKLMADLEAGAFELYDLAADPGETTDVLAAEPEAFRRLRRALFEHLEAVEGGAGNPRALDAARRAQEQLEALGYIQ